MNIEYLRALRLKLRGEEQGVIEDLRRLLTTEVSIADHVNVSEDVYNLVKKIDSVDSEIDTINKLMTKWGIEQ